MNAVTEIKSQIAALDPNQRDLKNLGLVFAVVALLVAGIMAYKGGSGWVWAVVIGALFAGLGLFSPRVLKPLYLVWMSLASILGYFVSRIILAVLYFLVITPIGLFMRLIGKDILDKKMDSKQSYWHRRANQSNDPARLEKMY